MDKEGGLKCPKCGSEIIMSYRWEPYYKLCARCKHEWRDWEESNAAKSK